MDKEPNELVEARSLLKKWEGNPGDSERLSDLKQGIRLLIDIIMGDCAQVYKDRAANLVGAHRNRVLTEVKGIISNADSYELEFLAHWDHVMEVFADAALDDDPDFKRSKEKLFTIWGIRLVKNLKPWEIEMLKRELQNKTTPDKE